MSVVASAWALLIVTSLWAQSPPAMKAVTQAPAAEAATIEGWVIAFNAPDVVIDLGRAQGVHPNDVVELWRPLKLKHPVTGRVVTDRFRIGTLELVQVRDLLSWAHPTASPERPVAIGDIVILRREVKENPEPVSPPPPAEPRSAPAASATTAAPSDADRVARLFESQRGKPPLERARAYEAFARATPSRYDGILLEEAELLRRGAAAFERAIRERQDVLYQADLPSVVRPGRPFSVALWMPGKHAGAVLELRSARQPAYRSLPMRRVGDFYYEATIPSELVEGPSLHLFVERVDTEGRTHPLVGSASEPNIVDVREEPDLFTSPRYHGQVALVTDYADWNRGRGNDYAWQTEGDVGFRVHDTGIRALHSGFGVYRGRGGSVEELDRRHEPPRSVGLTYGYLEGELGFSQAIGMILRAAVGLGESGVQGGGQLYLRFGHDQRTNLRLGGELLGGIGLRAVAELELRQFERVPLMLRSEVTNQPVGTSTHASPSGQRGPGDVGVRTIAQVGYRVSPALTVALRGSYQGRNIRHAGPGGGAALSYSF